MDRNQAEQEESGGVPSSSKRLPISQFRRAEDGVALPTRNNLIPGSKERPLPEECGVPTPTSEGRRGLRGSHRQGREGPKTPTATPAVPCSKRDYCNPLCREETAAKFIVTGLLPELRGQGLPRACITLGLQLVHSQLGAVCLCSGGGVAGQRMAT